MTSIKIYEYGKCSTCRNALKFLDRLGIPYKKVDITETPPSEAELREMLAHLKGDLRKLFNTSGLVYRELKLGEKLDGMPESEAIRLLASNGKLVKRPFVLTKDGGTVGFREPEWRRLFRRA